MRVCLFIALASLVAMLAPARGAVVSDPTYEFATPVGKFNVQLFPDIAPETVANFQSYLASGAYLDTFFHRSVPGFIVQGGGFTLEGNTLTPIPSQPPVVNEYQLSNLRGTIAMAKVGGDPNSATSQWFFNLGDNSANLNNQNGGFTVFGRIVGDMGLAVMDQIAALPTRNIGGPYNQLPVFNHDGTSSVQANNLVFISIRQVVPEPGSAHFLALGFASLLSLRRWPARSR